MHRRGTPAQKSYKSIALQYRAQRYAGQAGRLGGVALLKPINSNSSVYSIIWPGGIEVYFKLSSGYFTDREIQPRNAGGGLEEDVICTHESWRIVGRKRCYHSGPASRRLLAVGLFIPTSGFYTP